MCFCPVVVLGCMFLSCCAVGMYAFVLLGCMFLSCWDVKNWELPNVNKMKPTKRVLVFHPTLVQGSTYKHNWAKHNFNYSPVLSWAELSVFSFKFLCCHLWFLDVCAGLGGGETEPWSFILFRNVLAYVRFKRKLSANEVTHAFCFPQTYEIFNFNCVCL